MKIMNNEPHQTSLVIHWHLYTLPGLLNALLVLGHGSEILSSPSHDFEKLMRLFFIIHYSSKN